MTKKILLLIALAIAPSASAMKRELKDASSENVSKKIKKVLLTLEELSAQVRVQHYLASNPFALHIACTKKKVEIVRTFVSAKAPTNTRDGQGRTPLHHIYAQYHTYPHYPSRAVEIARLLLAYDASEIDRQDNAGNTPLHLAAQDGALDVVDILLQFGANPNIRNNAGKLALHLAIQYKYAYKVRNKMVKKLIEFNANVNTKDRHGATPLHYAAFYGHWIDSIPLLIKAGAQYLFDDKEEGPLHYVFKEELEEAERDEEFWVEIVNTHNVVREFDHTFATLLWAFPGYADSFTTQDREAMRALLFHYQINSGIDIVEPPSPDNSSEQEGSSSEEFYDDPYFDSIMAFGRAVEIMIDANLQKEAVENAGEDLRRFLISSIDRKQLSITKALQRREITGSFKPTKLYP